MFVNLQEVDVEYANNDKLKKDEVGIFLNWVNLQPHLPKITELQAILFFHACYYNEEEAKKKIDTFFTLKTQYQELFKNRNPLMTPVKENLNVFLYTPLSKKTPEGYTIMFLKIMDTRPGSFNCLSQLKIFDMIKMLHLHQDGTSEGHITLFDMKGAAFRHLFRISPSGLKKFLHYIQDGMPERMLRIHFFNIVPFMDTAMALIKPFIKKEFADTLYFHKSVDDLTKFVPLECLPQDYGGTVEDTLTLHENIKKRIQDNVDFFEWEEQQNVDESKRNKS